MMTLEEAITHAEKRASADCSECAKEHAQLAEWLKELKSRRGAEMTNQCGSNRSDIIHWHDLRENPDDLPELKGGYSEAVILWTNGRKPLTAIYDGTDFLCDASYWDAFGEDVIAWYYAPVFKEDE